MKHRPVQILAAAASAAALLSVAACGSGSGGSTGGGGTGSAAHPVKLTFWGWAKGTKEVVDEFNKTHKNIKVTYEETPSGNAGGYAKLSNAVKAKNAPDVASIEYPQLPDFVAQGAVQDITSQVKGVTGKFLPQSVQLTTLGGKNWALPLDIAPQVFLYRKDLFAKAGITTPPKTWADFKTDAQKIKKNDPKSRIATFFPDDPSTVEGLAWQNGATWFATQGNAWHVDMQDAKTKQVDDYWQDLVKNDLVNVQPSFSQQWNAGLKNGTTAGYIGAAWSAGVLKGSQPDQKGKWAVAPVPNWGTPASGVVGGSTFVVMKGSKKADAAVQFIEWMTTSKDAMKARISSGDSSAYPADPDLVATAAAGFDKSYYGGQDIYSLFGQAAKTIKPGWTWGPTMTGTNLAIKTQFGKITSGGATVGSAVAAGRADALKALKDRGLKTK